MGLITVTPAVGLPVSLDTVKGYLRIDGSDEDDQITELMNYAAEFIERETGQQMLTATKRLYLDKFPAAILTVAGYPVRWPGGVPYQIPTTREIAIPSPPLQSVTSVKYLVGGVETTWSSSNYTVDVASKPGRIVLNDGVSWPTDCDVTANAVRIEFVCGYGLAASVPALFKQAIRWLVGHAYENREASTELNLRTLPIGLQSVIESLMFREAFGA